jgi:ribosome recycling factor
MDDQFTTQIKSKMLKALEITKIDLGAVKTGRATPALVEHILISAYDGTQKLKVQELATLSTSDAKTLVIHPFDPTTRDEIVKGIQEANVGLTPIAEASEIRISIPSLSEERRQEYIKLARAKLEAGRIMIRQIRHEEMVKLKRSFEGKEMTEDEKKREEKLIQQTTDEVNDEVDRLGEMKEKELLQV